MNRLHNILFLFAILLTALDAQVGTKPVAGVGSNIITRAELDALVAPESPDSIEAGLAGIAAVRNWQLGELIRHFASDPGISDEIGPRIAGYKAWRDHLLGALARQQYPEQADANRALIDEIYNYRNTAIHSRFLVAGDSLSAVDLRKRWSAGGRFETLALTAFKPTELLAMPGMPGWRYPKDLDSNYAQTAFNQAIGEISQPLLIDGQYYLIQTLQTHFRPDHGHFERPKHKQNIAAELPVTIGVSLAVAEDDLDSWATGLPLKWKRWSSRKVLKSGVLASHQSSAAAEAPTLEILEIVLGTLDGRDYTVDWVLERLELLPPNEHFAIENATDLRELITSILKWNRLIETVGGMPDADAIFLEAENLRLAAIQATSWQTLRSRYLADYKIPAELLAAYLATNRATYMEVNLADITELVIADSSLAAVLADSIRGGAAFGKLAAMHTMRKWARITGGHLGWVPIKLYHPHADSLKKGAGTLVGPLVIGEYHVLLEVRDYVEPPEPTVRNLRERLRYNWLEAYKDSLITDWIWAMDRSSGMSWLDTNLVLGIEVQALPDDNFESILELQPADSLINLPDAMSDSSTAVVGEDTPPIEQESSSLDMIFEAGQSGAGMLTTPDSSLVSPDFR